jgi:ABC-2 type transport system permease protein
MEVGLSDALHHMERTLTVLPVGRRLLSLFRAFLRRDYAKARSYRTGFLFQFIGILFSLSMYYFTGRFVDQSTLATNPALDRGYFAFIFVGTTLLQFASFALSIFSNSMINEQATGTLEALIVTPSPLVLLIVLGAGYDLIVLLITLGFSTLAAVLFFDLRVVWGFEQVVVLLLVSVGCSVFFGAIGLVMAAFTAVAKRGATRPIGIMTGVLGLVSGIFYPTDVLPRPLQLLSELVPLTWSVRVLRAALLEDRLLWGYLGLLFVAAAIAVPAGLIVFGRGLDRARREGTLSQY